MVRRIWKLESRTHNNLLHIVNQCMPIDIQLEKRCIKFIYNLFNSIYPLHQTIMQYSLNNMASTLGKNVRYFMHKYDIIVNEWNGPFYIIISKIRGILCQI